MTKAKEFSFAGAVEKGVVTSASWLEEKGYPVSNNSPKADVISFTNKAIRVLAMKPYSEVADDWYLRVVLCELANETTHNIQYVVWTENLEDELRAGQASFNHGDYYPGTQEGFADALEKFNSRGNLHGERATSSLSNVTVDELAEELTKRAGTTDSRLWLNCTECGMLEPKDWYEGNLSEGSECPKCNAHKLIEVWVLPIKA